MSNLTNNNTALGFTLKSLAETRFNSPIALRLKDQDLLTFLIKLIGEIHFKCGITINSNELKAVSVAFKQELKFFPYLTIVEIEKAFNQGYKERYGKYYGLNIKTFIQWLDGYIQSERNDDLNKARKKKSKKEISDIEKSKYIKSGMKKCLDHYKETRSILDGYSTFLYQVLYDDGFLPKDKETKVKFYNNAKEFLEINLNGTKAKSQEEFKNIKSTLEEIQKPKSIKVIAQAQEMIVNKFLRDAFKDEDKINKLFNKYL